MKVVQTLEGRIAERRLLAGLLSVILVAGTFSVWWMVAQADHDLREDLLADARLVAGAVDLERVHALTGTEDDLKSPDYLRLKKQFAEIRTAQPRCRFVYLMGRRADGKVFFFLDSEPFGSKDESPPGQVYEEAPDGVRRVFDTGLAQVEGPVSDRWGTWVSALVPLTDRKTDKIIAVQGMDIDAHDWQWAVAVRAALPAGLVLLTIIGVVSALSAMARVGSSPKPVTRRLMPFMAVTIMALIAGAGLLLWYQQVARLAERNALVSGEIALDFKNAVQQHSRALATAAQPVVTDARLLKALAAKDARRLLSDWRSLYETLNREQSLTDFCFFDADRVCLLRLAEPEKRGDRIEHFTVLEAERTGKTASGIELGPPGALTLRVVRPVFDADRLVGYVELGKGIDAILQTLPTPPGVRLAVVVHKEHLSRQKWGSGMPPVDRKVDFDGLPNSVVIYASRGRLPEAFAQAAAHHGRGWREHAVHAVLDKDFAEGGRDWHVTGLPIADASGTEVGMLLVTNDITDIKAHYRRTVALGELVGAVLSSMLLSLSFVMLRRTDAGIRAQQAELRTREAQMRAITATARDAIVMLDPQGMITFCNPATERLFGYTHDELIGQNLHSLLVPQRFQAAHQEAFARFRITGQGAAVGKTVELAGRHKDGREIPVEVSLAALKMPDGWHSVGTMRDITERKQAEQLLLQSNERFEQLAEQSRTFVWEVDASGLYTFVGKSVSAVLGYEPEELVGKMHFYDLHPQGSREAFKAAMLEVLAAKNPFVNLESQAETKAGQPIWLSKNGMPILDNSGNLIGYRGSDVDVTDRVKMRNELADSERRYRSMWECATEAFCLNELVTDDNGVVVNYRILDVNPAYERIMGVKARDVIGKLATEAYNCAEPPYLDIYARVAQTGVAQAFETRFRQTDQYFSVSVFSPSPGQFAMAFMDISERKKHEDAAAYQALHDSLTNLPNRQYLERHLENRIGSSGGKRSKATSVLFVDLDGFKLVNDTLGHKTGDLLLIEVAKRLQACLRPEDVLVRIGGDEFTVILNGGSPRATAQSVASRMIDSISRPFDIEGHRFVIGASIGIASYPADGGDAATLLRHVDAAMYKAKQSGKGKFCWFTRDIDVHNQQRVDMQADIHVALTTNQFKVYYQPIVSLGDGSICAAEALLRWEHPDKGMISPSLFIPVAEQTGMIEQIGEYVLRTACAQTAMWREEGIWLSQIAVNMSPREIRAANWVDLVRAALSDAGLDAQSLNLEVTESNLVADYEAMVQNLLEVQRLGVCLCIDDFGMGQSSLSQLQRLPVSHIKIDGSFVRGMEGNVGDSNLASSIIDLAHGQGLKVTAEWVETESQLELLRSMGCDFAQGYFISPALPAKAFGDFVRQRMLARRQAKAA